nr:hypothetical protein [Tanacetum cinerariifolium]
MIKLVLRHQNTQQFGAMLLVELTNEDIKNSAAYKEYYAISSGAAPPKTKASLRKTQSSSDTTMPPLTAASTRHSTSAKGKQPAKSSKAKGLSVLSEVALTKAEQMKLATKRSLQQTYISQASGSGANEGTGIIPGVPDVPTDESDEEISWKLNEEEKDDDDQDDNGDDQDSDNNGNEFIHPKLSTHDKEAKDEESFDPIVQTPSHVEDSDDESNDDESHGMNVGGEEGPDAENDDEELYRDANINLEGYDVQITDVHTTQVLEDTHVTLTPVNPDGQQQSLSVSSQFVTSLFNPSPDAGIDSLFESTPRVDVPVTTTVVPLLVTAPTLPPPSIPIMFDHRLKTLKANFSEFMQTNQFAEAVSSIPMIVDRYIDHRINEAVKVVVQLQSDMLQNEAQAKNEDFINKLDENIQKIIKEQVKEQVKVQVSKILPKIEKTVNEQLEAEVLTRSSNSSKTSYAVAADLSELELKKILIEKMESNKCHDDADTDKEPLVGSDRGSKRRREGKESESTSAPKEKVSKTTTKSTDGSKSHQKTASESAPTEEPMQTTQDLEEPSHQEFETSAADDQPISEASQHPECISNESTQCRQSLKLIAGPTYELMKGSCKILVKLEFFLEEVYKATTDQLDQNNPEGQQYPHNLLKPLPLIPNSRGRRIIPFDHLSITTSSIYPDTYRSDLKRKEAYTAYSNPRGFIYQNKDKLNRLMRIDELHKLSNGTLNDVRTALDDRLKGIRIKYLPQTIWKRSDKERAAAMIQAIDKQLKTRRIMRCLEKFVGGRLYEGDFMMLQRTI